MLGCRWVQVRVRKLWNPPRRRASAVMASQLLGEIKERQPGPGSRRKPVSNGRFVVPTTGFPVAQHRSKVPSTFARARAQQQGLQVDPSEQSRPPVIVPSVSPIAARDRPKKLGTAEGLDRDWRGQMQRQNDELLADMTEEEKQREREALLVQFGGGLVDLVKKAKARREGKDVHFNHISLTPTVTGLSSPAEAESLEASRQRERPPHLDISSPAIPASPRE
jgi:hypothetical protein